MKITIGGLPGSGSSTAARLLSKKLKIKHIDAGDIWDKMAKEYKTDILGLSQLAEKDRSIDRKLDEKMLSLAQRMKNGILEGRLIGWLCYKNKIPTFKIWFKAPQGIRIKRICQRDGGKYKEIYRKTKEREKSEAKRYLEYYNIDINDLSIYDLIVDSSKMKPDQIVSFILKKLKK